MKSIKTAKYLNVFNIFFVIITTVLLTINVMTQSIFQQIKQFTVSQQVIIEKIVNSLNIKDLVEQVNFAFNNMESISLIVAFIVIFLMMGIIFIFLLLINSTYKKIINNEELTYGLPIVAGFFTSVLMFFIINQLTINLFNFLIFNNGVFNLIIWTLLITTVIQIGLIIKYLVTVYQERKIELSAKSLSKMFSVVLIITFVSVAINIAINLTLYLFGTSIINGINYVNLLQINTLIDWLINQGMETLKVNDIQTISSGVDLANASLQVTLNNFIQSSLVQVLGSLVLPQMIPAIITLVLASIVTYFNNVVKTTVIANKGMITWIITSSILAVYLIITNGIIFGSIIGIAMVIIIMLKAILIYQNNPAIVEVAKEKFTKN